MKLLIQNFQRYQIQIFQQRTGLTSRIPANAKSPHTAHVNDYMREKTSQLWHIFLPGKDWLGGDTKLKQETKNTVEYKAGS